MPPFPRPATPSRWTAIALAISLALNLVVAGMVLGQHLWPMKATPEKPATPPHPPFDAFLKTLPPEAQPTLKDAIAAYQPTAMMYVNQIREARRAAIDQLRQKPFDPRAASAAFAHLRDLQQAAQASVQETGIAAYATATGQSYTPALPSAQP